MEESPLRPMRLFSDGLALVYHEARNVRHLIQGGHLQAEEWQGFVNSLPRNRVEAWKSIQSSRGAARDKPTPHSAERVFLQRFGKTVAELEALFRDSNWKHANAWGGHAWRQIVAAVADLGRAIEQDDGAQISEACAQLVAARHNNGLLRDKMAQLDNAIGAVHEPAWRSTAVP